MSPNVALKMQDDAHVGGSRAFTFPQAGNSNVTQIKKPRRRFVRQPLPPQNVRGLSQRIQAADEHWQELIEAQNKRQAVPSDASDLVMFAALSCFIHSLTEDKKLCGQFLKNFDKQLKEEKSQVFSSFS
jgi:cytochrome P450